MGPYHLYIYIWSYSLVTNPYNEMALQIPNWGYFTPKTGSGGPPCRTPRHISCMTAKISSWNIHHANKYIKISFQTLQTHHFLQIFVGNPGHYHLSPATTFENIYIYMFANKITSLIRSNGFTRVKKTCQLCNRRILFPCLGFTRDS